MSDYQFTETAKHEYRTSFMYFLENRTEFDQSVKEFLVDDLNLILDATDTYHAVGKIELDNIGLENEEELELVKLTSAYVDYDLFFDDPYTLIFSSKLVYTPSIPDADKFIEESNLKRFNVPYGMYEFVYEGDSCEEI